MTKYIVFWKYNPDALETVIKKSLNIQAEAEKEPEKYATYLFPPHHMGYCKGFHIVEVSDPSQITRSTVYWFPEMELKYVPITDNNDMLKTYQEMQQ
jgi:hypothetical protein